MQNFFPKYVFLIFSSALLFMAGCGTTGYQRSAGLESSCPLGVDSLTIAEADSLIPHLFVGFKEKQRAIQYYEQGQEALSTADSLWIVYQSEFSGKASIKADSTDDKMKKKRQNFLDDMKTFLTKAEKKFRKSVDIDPFSLNSRDGLVRTHFLKAEIEENKSDYEQAEHVLRDMIERERGEHQLFFNLGECCFNLENWPEAFENYKRATDVFLQTKKFNRDSSLTSMAQDSIWNGIYFTYLYSQSVSLSKMYRADEAIAMIQKAKEVASSDEHKSIADRYEKWLNWDNGNIQTAEKRNEILKLVNEEKYGEAAARFEKLGQSLSDGAAKDEIEWRIAGLEFQYLNKKEQACERLLRVVRQWKPIALNSKNEDEKFQQYLKDCGAMHYHVGMSYIDKSDYRLARQYLDIGAEIDWFGKYKCQLELAKINKHNPQLSLDLIEKVLSVQSNLSVIEQLDALQIKLKVLKKLGPQYLAEAKQTYLQIRELQKN